MHQPQRRRKPTALSAHGKSADTWQVRAGPLMGLPAVLTALNVAAAPVLTDCGLPADALDDANRWINFDQAARMLLVAAQHAGRPDLGLLMAESAEAGTLGVVAARMSVAPTVGAALRVLMRDFHLHDRGAVPYVSRPAAGRAALGYALSRHDTPGAAVAYDLAIGIALKLLRQLCGPGFHALAVSFMHGAPRDQRPYRRFFGVPVAFDAAHTQIEFDAAWLDAPLAGAEEAVRGLLQQAASSTDAAGAERSLTQRTRSVAQALLMAGGLSEARIGAELGMHVRTLRRRLMSEGSGVKAIIVDVRFEQARQLLSQTRLPLAEVALALQYTDFASFARAFKAWAGVAPGRWRQGQPGVPAGSLSPPADP